MAGPAPFFQNSPTFNGKTPNLIFSDVYQGTLNNPVINIPNNDGILFLPMSGWTFPVRYTQIKTFRKDAYAAGTAGVYTLNLSSVTPTVGKQYKVTIYSGDGTIDGAIAIATASTTSANDLAAAINTSLANLNLSTIFTTTVLNSTITFTEVTPASKGLSVIFSDTNAVFATSTANVPAFGTVAQVALYKSSVTTGTYNRYQFGLEVSNKNFEGSGTDTKDLVFVEIWIDTGATGYSTADTQMTQFQPGGSYWGSTYSNILAIPKG